MIVSGVVTALVAAGGASVACSSSGISARSSGSKIVLILSSLSPEPSVSRTNLKLTFKNGLIEDQELRVKTLVKAFGVNNTL